MFLFHDKHLTYKFAKTTTIDALFLFVIYLYVTFWSPYLSTLGWSESTKGLFFALFSFAGIFAAPIVGAISDKIGRFHVIMVGIFFEIIALSVYVLSQNIILMMLVRLISGFAYNAVVISALARINDTVKDDNVRSRATGLYQSLTSIAFITAPLIGGFIADNYGFKSMLTVSTFSMIGLLVLILLFDSFFYKEPAERKRRAKLNLHDFNPFTSVSAVFKFKEMRHIIFLGACSNITAPLLTQVLPFIIISRMGLSNSHLSICIFMIGFAHVLQYVFGVVADKIGKHRGILLGLFVSGFAYILMFFTNSFELLLLAILLHAFGGALWNVSAWSFMSDTGEKYNIEGKIVGSYTSISRIFIMVSAILSGFLLDALGEKIFFVYGAVILIPLLITFKYFFTYNPKAKDEETV